MSAALTLARMNGLGRIAIGAGMLVAPTPSVRGWIGKDAARGGPQAITRALGIRDLVLGFLTVHVAGRPGVGSRTLATVAVVDAVDLAATVAARDQLPRSAAQVMAIAGTSALSLTALAVALR